jgi:hypothetical protein
MRRRSAVHEWTATFPDILFHPDCDRRLRTLTGSADPRELRPPEALAGLRVFGAPTAGGEFHPALRTSNTPAHASMAWTGLHKMAWMGRNFKLCSPLRPPEQRGSVFP